MMDMIAADRRALADALDEVTAEQWRGGSLCAGWTPAHVLAHMTMPFRISGEDFMAGLQRCGGDFSAFSDEVAETDSRIPPAELISVLRDNAENPWSPPGGGLDGALSHQVIHGLDIIWPLDIQPRVSDVALTSVLDSITSPGTHTFFDFPLTGLEVSATDLAWSTGSGASLAGRARDLLMLLAGRDVPRNLFSGEGAAQIMTAP
jgi:uncharacterized protein (TIGR03083 family)